MSYHVKNQTPHYSPPVIISFTNYKGGVAKTTSSVSMAKCMSSLGYYTTIIDFDPQGDTATLANIDTEKMVTTEENLARSSPSWARSVIANKLSITPCSPELENIEKMLVSTSEPNVVKRAAAKIRNNSLCTEDFVFIDTPPKLLVLTEAAVRASDYVIITMNPEPMDLKALTRTIEFVKVINSRIKRPQLLGILFTRDTHTKVNREIIDMVNEAYPGLAFNTTIRATTEMVKAPLRGYIMDIVKSNLAMADYMEVSKEILERINYGREKE